MISVVPFIHSLTDESASAWIKMLRLAMPEINIMAFPALSQMERDSVEVAIVANPNPGDLLELPNLKWVQSLWAGVERLISELPNDNIAVVRLVDPQLAETMAEAVLAWTLYLHRDMPEYAAQQAQQLWSQHDVAIASERTIGVLGLGHLGRKAAERLHLNGFNVLGWSRTSKNLEGIETLSEANGLSQIASSVDILVVLLPSTPQTRGLLDHRFFDQLKPGASLINFARADIIDSPALTKGLESGQIGHAVLDVFLNEPLAQTDPLWLNKHITILPHISAPTNLQTAAQIVAENIQTYFASNIVPKAVSRHEGY